MKASPTKRLSPWERFNTEMISVTIIAVLLTIGLAILKASPFWVLDVWITWAGSAYLLAYMGKESPQWDTRICLIMGALAPLVIIFIVIVAYLPGNVTRFKYRTK